MGLQTSPQIMSDRRSREAGRKIALLVIVRRAQTKREVFCIVAPQGRGGLAYAALSER